MNKYIGHTNQMYGVEEIRLMSGKGDGMKMYYVRNGIGMEMWISVDRCGDISRLTFKGDNFGYFAPCGYVSPKYYEKDGNGFLKSFTAGFLTTCGLTSVGTPCIDNGELTPMHGTISNTPCENSGYWIENNDIHIKMFVRDAALFSHKLIMEREYIISLDKNEFTLTDKIKNIGSLDSPLEILYHCNVGYPLLCEKTKLIIPSIKVTPRDEHAKKDIKNCLKIELPQGEYKERCYYHTVKKNSDIILYNPNIQKGICMTYDVDELPCFTEWKMMGEYEYVIGIEPGNCFPDGRLAMREKGILEFLKAGEAKTYHLKFKIIENI